MYKRDTKILWRSKIWVLRKIKPSPKKNSNKRQNKLKKSKVESQLTCRLQISVIKLPTIQVQVVAILLMVWNRILTYRRNKKPIKIRSKVTHK